MTRTGDTEGGIDTSELHTDDTTTDDRDVLGECRGTEGLAARPVADFAEARDGRDGSLTTSSKEDVAHGIGLVVCSD